MLVVALILGSGIGWQPGHAQTPRQKYFPQTGHWVTGEFLDVYEQAKDPLLLYGNPITDGFLDQATGLVVQYFERVRMEHHTEMPDQIPVKLRVRLAPLGAFMYDPGEPADAWQNSPACKKFSQTGYRVCYQFYDFFQEYGGIAQFGYPISNLEIHHGQYVQYFQMARLEWHPELPYGQRVRVGDLGREYFKLRGESEIRLRPNLTGNVIQTTLRLKVAAFAQSPVTSRQGRQTIYITVQDQNNTPVAGAQVRLRIRLPSGEEADLPVKQPTDKHGITHYSFSFKTERTGAALVWAVVQYKQMKAETVTSFRIWY